MQQRLYGRMHVQEHLMETRSTCCIWYPRRLVTPVVLRTRTKHTLLAHSLP